MTLGFAQQFRGIKNLGIVLRVLRALGHPGLAAEAIEVCFLTNEVFAELTNLLDIQGVAARSEVFVGSSSRAMEVFGGRIARWRRDKAREKFF